MPANVASGIVAIAASSTGRAVSIHSPPRQIVHENERDAAQRQPKPKQIGGEPGTKEARRIDNDRDEAEGGSDRERQQDEPGRNNGGAIPSHCSVRLISGGTSVRSAIVLACSARI